MHLPTCFPSHTVQCWVSLFRAAQGTILGQPNFCCLVEGKAQGKTLFKKEMSSLEFFHFNLCFAQASILDFEIYWWFLHIQTAADTSPSRLKGTPRTRRWSLLPHALIHTQTKQYQAGVQLHTSFSGLFLWMTGKCPSNTFMGLFLQNQDSFSEMCKWYGTKFFHFTSAWYCGLSASHWKQVECCHWLQGEP